MPPVEPMLAKSVATLPVAEGMSYEPKWDGFRIIIFRDGAEVELTSRGGKTMTRYFPEIIAEARRQLPARCVLDGELVVIRRDGPMPRLDFDQLSQRIHPADSRVRQLAVATPADFVAFDLLALDDRGYLDEPYARRRADLSTALASCVPPMHLTPATTAADTARRWFATFEGAGLDGVVAKPARGHYTPGRRAMFKIKHARTADVVVAGLRYHKSGPVVGSLLLGLYDEGGTLHHVGVCASFTDARRRELLAELAPYRQEADSPHPWLVDGAAGQRLPGGVSRWTGGKDLSWQPLRPELVAEVGYDAMEGDTTGGESGAPARFRHTARFIRWRPDRTPDSCTYEQLIQPVRFNVDQVLAGTP